MYMEKGSSGLFQWDFNLAIGAIVLLLILMGKQKTWFRFFIPLGSSFLLPFLKQDGDPLETPSKRISGIRCQCPGGAICYGIALILLIIPFAWDLALLPYYWSLAVLTSVITMIKLRPNCAWEVRSKRQVMRAIPWLSLRNVTQVSSGIMSYANSLGNDVVAMCLNGRNQGQRCWGSRRI